MFCNGYPGNVGFQTIVGWGGYIDLAGYKQSDLTFVVQGISWEDAAAPVGVGEGFVVLDILSTQTYITIRTGTNMTVEDNNEWYIGQDTPSPGMPDSILDMEQILFCRKSTYYHDAGWSQTNLQQLSTVNQYGQCGALAGDRIYVTRLLCGSMGNTVTDIHLPSSVVNVAGVAVEEDDKAYIMRLRRDYELARTVDA